jgi:dynein heavy chain 2
VEITWKTPSECEHYVERLQMAAEKLALENNALRRTHSQLAVLVVNIMSVDLLKQKDLWKQRWQECLAIMDAVRRKFPEEHMVRWVRFWDEQMFKALEASYRMGLESLNENLSEIKTDLVFSQKALQFKPGIEELRSVYYREMKKFVSIPSTFPGFGSKGVYGGMAKRNTSSLLNVYRNAEELFTRLSSTLEEYRPWCVLNKIDDMDAYVDEHVKEVNQYEANFKMLKNKRKDGDKLPDIVKVDCVKINLSPFKSSLDESMSRLQDSLLIALRRAVLNEFKDVDQFLNDSMEKLSTRPNSIAEISAAQSAWEEMGLVQVDHKAKSASCLEKKKSLMIHAPGSGVDVSEVVSRISNLDGEGGRWDNFDIAMDAFNEMINEQKEALTSVLELELQEFNGSIDRFYEKWKALKPTGDGLKLNDSIVVDKVFKDLESWKEQYEDFKDKGCDFVEQCITFSIPSPIFVGLDSIEKDITTCMETWELLKKI